MLETPINLPFAYERKEKLFFVILSDHPQSVGRKKDKKRAESSRSCTVDKESRLTQTLWAQTDGFEGSECSARARLIPFETGKAVSEHGCSSVKA